MSYENLGAVEIRRSFDIPLLSSRGKEAAKPLPESKQQPPPPTRSETGRVIRGIPQTAQDMAQEREQWEALQRSRSTRTVLSMIFAAGLGLGGVYLWKRLRG